MQRKDKEEDYELMRMLIAARAPMTKDGGTSLLKTLQTKHKDIDMGDGVTPESRRRDLERARQFLARHAKKT